MAKEKNRKKNVNNILEEWLESTFLNKTFLSRYAVKEIWDNKRRDGDNIK
jgi:hypothetical protein